MTTQTTAPAILISAHRLENCGDTPYTADLYNVEVEFGGERLSLAFNACVRADTSDVWEARDDATQSAFDRLSDLGLLADAGAAIDVALVHLVCRTCAAERASA